MHRVNLENNNTRLDLISDIEILKPFKKKYDYVSVERVVINEDNKKIYNKSPGEYISISFDDSTDYKVKENISIILTKELKKIINKKKLNKKPVLIVGLGNNYSTPDSLGPKVIKNIITTRHISIISKLDKRYSVVSKISPDVFGNTGIETFDIIKGIVKMIKPKYLIVIDSLSSKSLDKVNKVIQLTDSGIDPGSGVGNQRKGISFNTLGIEVISIGVPTVVSLHTIIKDTLNEYNLDEVLSSKTNNFMVTPKEIDFVIQELSLIIAKSINNALHNKTK